MSVIVIQATSTPTALTHSLDDYMNCLYAMIAQRAFSIFERNGKTHGHALENWREAECEFLTPIRVELSETDDELSVRAEVPGFTERDLEIVVEPRCLFITGTAELKTEDAKKKKTLYSEISSNEVFRSICLPCTIDPASANALLKNGILEIAMHKSHQRAVPPDNVRLNVATDCRPKPGGLCCDAPGNHLDAISVPPDLASLPNSGSQI